MSTPADRPRLRVALVGHAFMGAAHSRAWRLLGQVYDLPARVEMAVLCGRDRARTEAAATRLGWRSATTDWRAAVEDPGIDVVDVCTPVGSHAPIATAALAAGKHVVCEKPLARDGAEAAAMAAAAAAAAGAGVRAMCGFNYRRVPALALMRRLVADGRIGAVRQLRAAYLQDWGADPATPASWRFVAKQAGSGALGDLGSHVVDAAQYVCGEPIAEVVATMRTVVPARPPVSGTGPAVPVDVDDVTAFLARFGSGAVGTVEATRLALGYKNAFRLEVHGETGSLGFDLESLNELRFHDGADPPELGGFRRILVTEPGHPYLAAWWPPGHLLGWAETFVHQLADFVAAVCGGPPVQPDFAAAAQVQRVLDAVAASAAERRWVSVAAGEPDPRRG